VHRDPAQRARQQATFDALLAVSDTLALTLDEALEGGRIRGRLRRAGRQMEVVDSLLAARALLRGDVLLTADQDFAPLASEIRIENWLR
jgi:predicted nucleic acid-binding protein